MGDRLCCLVMDLERTAVNLLRSHLAIAIPLTVLGLRLFARWVAREEPKEIISSVLRVPLDFIYISISLILSGLARLTPQFEHRYGSDTDLVGSLFLLAIFFLAVLLTWAEKGKRVIWQKYIIASKQLQARTQQPGFDWKQADKSVTGRTFWMFCYWVLLVVFQTGETFASLTCLWYVISRIK